MPFTYNDPILSRRRKGDSTDPFVLIEESIQVPEGATYQLTEIPSRLGKVTIPGLVEVQQIPPDGLKENEYYVDYVEGLVTVHPSKIGQTLINKYEGTGARFFPASRVWTEQRDGEVVKTLKDIIDIGNDAIEAIEKLDEIVRKAEEATDEANEAADRVNTIADQVEEAENLRVIAEQERNNAEAERRSAENERIANENQRIANEQERESAEADRINEENIRISNENQRIANEQARIDAESVRADAEEIRKNNEDQRIANEQARENAEEDRIAAEEQRVINEQLREAAEAVRESAEVERVDNENQRIANEQTRENAEIARINAEAEREANELIRQQQEADRQANTAEAINNANQAAQNAQNLVDTSIHRGEFDFNSQYQKNNHVRYNGSTWRALQDVKGVAPQEGEYWTLVAQRGLDGQGSVTTVNNKSPDLNGNVQLVPEDIGAENASNKGMPNGYAPLDETGNIPEEFLGNIESMKMHGNEWHTEEFETVQGAQAKVNAVQSDLSAHTSATTGVHGATSTATPNTLVQRDPAGRFKAAAPVEDDDVARKAEVDAHATRTDNPHNTTAAQVGALPKKSFSSGIYDFNNRGAGSFIEEIKNNASITIQNGPSGFSSGALIQTEGSHDRWIQQIAIQQTGRIFFRIGRDASGVLTWDPWNELTLKNDYVRVPGYAATSGSANNYTVTLNPAPTSYTDGMCVAVKINTTNTGASTLNVNGLGAKPIKKPNGNDVGAGNLKAGSIYTFRYNATTGNFILQGEGGDFNVGDTITDTRLLPLSSGRGTEIWANTDVASGADVAVDSAGNVYCAHDVGVGNKAIRKLDSSGNEIWSKTDVGNGMGIAVDSAGYVYCAHYVTSGNKSIRKLDSSGNEIWAKTDVVRGRGIAVDSAGNVYCAHDVGSANKAIRKLDGNRYFQILG